MKRLSLSLVSLLLMLLAACKAKPTSSTDMLHLEYTPATRSWLPAVYDCAHETSLLVSAEERLADYLDPSADMLLRLGEPDRLTQPAYALGSEELVVILNLENPLTDLSAGQVQTLFSGQIRSWSELGGDDLAVQVWTYADGDDAQQLFSTFALRGQPVSSLARLAVSPESMLIEVGSDPAAIGFLPRSLLERSVKSAQIETDLSYLLTVPVLALTAGEPEGELQQLLICLQTSKGE